MSTTVFLDTNVFLHYTFFDEIDWRAVVKAEEVIIIIPPITVREIDKAKVLNPSKRTRRRAGKVIAKLSSLLESASPASLRYCKEVRFEDREPTIDFAEHQLDRKVQDDDLVAQIIMHRDENPESEVVLVTSDSGLLLRGKANRLGIGVVPMPDSMKLPEEPDSQEKRIKELEQQLRELNQRIPILSLAFENGKQRTRFSLGPPDELTPSELEDEVQQMKQDFPKLEYQSKQDLEWLLPVDSTIRKLVGDMLDSLISDDDVDTYNRRLDEYYQAYAKYLPENAQHTEIMRRVLKLAVSITNEGTVPAKDIDVFLHFPDGFELMNVDDLPKAPSPPQPPAKPKTRHQKMLDSVGVPRDWYDNVIVPRMPDRPADEENVSAPIIIRQASGYEVQFNVRRLKHGLRLSADPLYVKFESFDGARSFHLEYEMLADNVPKPVTGKLHVIISRD